MSAKVVSEQLIAARVIPVLRFSSRAQAEAAIECLLAAGFATVEVTMTTPDAVSLIGDLRRHSPSAFLVGAGTIRSADDARAARDAGSVFGVSPGYTAEQLEQEVAKKTETLDQEIATLKSQVSQRDESGQSRANKFKKAEADFRAAIIELESRLKDADSKLQLQETQLKDKEVVIQATATKEVEIGKLIKRLSQECENLSNELQEKTRLMGQLDNKKPQTQPDKNVWRRMIGRLQDDPL